MRLLGVVLFAAIVACGGVSSANTAGAVSTSGLVQSQYADCNHGGENLAKYLDTGEPKSNDPAYGNERQQVLALQGEQRALAIRQFADQYIETCADQEAKAEAQAAQAKAEAERKAAEEAQRQRYLQNAQANCGKVGGTWGSFVCKIDYRSRGDGQIYHYSVWFDKDGNIVPPFGNPKTEAECLKQDPTNTWHADSMICAI